MGFLDDVGNFAKGAVGFGLGGIPGAAAASQSGGPNYTSPTLDPGTQATITSNQNQLSQTPEQNAANIMKGTGSAANIADISGQQARDSQELGGGGMPGMSEAIANKAAKNFATSQGRLQQNANLQGAMMTNQNLNTAAANALALANAQRGVDSSLNQLNLQASAARYQTIGSLMSGAGSIAGMAYANPASPKSPASSGPGFGNYTFDQASPGSIELTEPMTQPEQSSGMGYSTANSFADLYGG